MEQTITITAPNLSPKTSILQFVLTLLFIASFGIGSLYLAFLPINFPFILRIISLLLGLLCLFVVPYALVIRFQASKRFITLDKTGITIKYDDYSNHIQWQNIKHAVIGMIVYTFKNDPKEADPYFLFTLKDGENLPKSISVKHRGREIFFVAQPADFKDFIGAEQNFSFAFSAKNFPEIEPQQFFQSIGLSFSTTRPFMDVKNTKDYNQVLKEIYLHDKVTEYSLPEEPILPN